MSQATAQPPACSQVLPEADCRDVAFAEFYARYQPRLLRYARRVWGCRDAEEITQEALVRAYESIDLNREARSQWGWLVVVSRNVATDLARSRWVCEVQGESSPDEAGTDPQAIEQSVLDSECLSTFGVALSALPPSQSRAWWLNVAEGLTPSVIAKSLDCSPEAVRQALFKSRKRLAAALADYCERTAALVAPALWFLKRAVHRGSSTPGQSVLSTATAAALASTAALVSVLGATAGHHARFLLDPHMTDLAVARSALAAVSHAHSEPLSAAALQRLNTKGKSGADIGTRPPTSTRLAVRTRTAVAKHPLAPGRQADEEVVIVTPVGEYGIRQGQDRGAGAGVLCGRTAAIKCR